MSALESAKRSARLLQVAWAVAVLFSESVFWSVVPAYREHVLSFALQSDTLDILHQMGVSVDGYVKMIVLRDVIIAGVLGIVGVALFVKRRSDPMCVLVSGAIVLSGVAFSSVLRVPVPPPASLFTMGAIVLARTFLFATMLVFPTWEFNPRWTRWLLFVWAAVATLVVFFAPGLEIVVSLVFLGIVILVQLYRMRYVYGVLERQQTKWLIVGMASVLAMTVSVNVGRWIAAIQLGPDAAQVFTDLVLVMVLRLPAVVIVPATLAISVSRYRLWDLEAIAAKATIYIAFSLFFAGMLFAALVTITYLNSIGILGGQLFVILTVSLTAGVVAQRAYTVVAEFLNRVFLPGTVQLERSAEEFLMAIRTMLDLPQIASSTIDVVMQGLSLKSCSLYIALDGRLERYAARGPSPPELPQPIVGELRETTTMEQPRDGEAGSGVSAIVSLVASMGDRREFVGVLVLGPRTNGRGYSTREEQVVLAIAREVAVSLHASTLVRRLTQTEARYESVVMASPVGIVVCDVSGSILLANDSAARIACVENADELLGMPLMSVFRGADDGDFESRVRRYARDGLGEPASFETILVCPDGKRTPVEVTLSAIGHNESDEKTYPGSEPGLVLVIRDVTVRREYEDRLRRANERVELYIDLLLHDVTNQLQAILGATELAMDAPDIGQSRKHLQVALDGVERCISIVSKVGSVRGITREKLKVVNLKASLEEALAAFRERHPDAIVKVRFDVDTALVNGLESLSDVWLSLLENAYVHNPSDERRVWVRLTERGDWFEVIIADNGPGISDKRKATLFDVGRRFGGVSLHVARDIVDVSGGQISVEDNYRRNGVKGTIFRVLLGRAEQQNVVGDRAVSKEARQ